MSVAFPYFTGPDLWLLKIVRNIAIFKVMSKFKPHNIVDIIVIPLFV